MRKHIDLFSKIKGILEYERGMKNYSQIGREHGITRQAVMHWVKNKELLFQEAQKYGIMGIKRMFKDLKTAEAEEQAMEDPKKMSKQQNEDRDSATIKHLQEENNFLKNKLLYFEKLMESYGINVSKVRKKKISGHQKLSRSRSQKRNADVCNRRGLQKELLLLSEGTDKTKP